MNIIEFAMQHMKEKYPVNLPFEYKYHQWSSPHVDGLLQFSYALTDVVLNIYNNGPFDLQARTVIHEYHHLTQLERHGAEEQIANRWKYELETEEFTREEFAIVLAKYSEYLGVPYG